MRPWEIGPGRPVSEGMPFFGHRSQADIIASERMSVGGKLREAKKKSVASVADAHGGIITDTLATATKI